MSALAATNRLLEALLVEVRGLRRALERQDRLIESPAHQALLEAISAILGDDRWTCEGVFREAQLGQDVEAAKLRAALAEIGARDARSLGTYLRDRVGDAGAGYSLRQHCLTRGGARQWSVRCGTPSDTQHTQRAFR